MEASKVIDEDSKIDAETLEKVFVSMVEAIKMRQCSEKGDKTMLDVLIPIHETFKVENTVGKIFEEILTEVRDAARDGVEFTKNIPAHKSTTSYFGDKSIGFEDPGAMSSLIMFRTLCGYCKRFIEKVIKEF